MKAPLLEDEKTCSSPVRWCIRMETEGVRDYERHGGVRVPRILIRGTVVAEMDGDESRREGPTVRKGVPRARSREHDQIGEVGEAKGAKATDTIAMDHTFVCQAEGKGPDQVGDGFSAWESSGVAAWELIRRKERSGELHHYGAAS